MSDIEAAQAADTRWRQTQWGLQLQLSGLSLAILCGDGIYALDIHELDGEYLGKGILQSNIGSLSSALEVAAGHISNIESGGHPDDLIFP